MKNHLPLFVLAGLLTACQNNHFGSPYPEPAAIFKPLPPIPATIGQIPLPPGCTRIAVPNHSFAEWLRTLPLRSHDNLLRLHNGQAKPHQNLHYAILDVPYNRHALQQCADAVMRLRAEYLYETKAMDNISFLHQRKTYFTCPSHCSRKQLEAFLQKVFSWCGTYNLQAQLMPKNIQQIAPGDVFVKAGSPGHAMLVADVAANAKGEQFFLLLQSFMPAQEIHLVKNTGNESMGAWYPSTDSLIQTPGWQFVKSDLRTW